MDDDALCSQTLDKIVRKLRGKYGFKRFLRDGYRTANEDQNRRYYKPAEMKVGVGGRRKGWYVYLLILDFPDKTWIVECFIEKKFLHFQHFSYQTDTKNTENNVILPGFIKTYS